VGAIEAAEIGRFVIGACHDVATVATPEGSDISANSDCCLLDRATGFRWVKTEAE
jgi:hypothetical protein